MLIMKRTRFFMAFVALLAVAGLSFTGPQPADVESYKVDTNESVINWKGYKVTGQHYGTVKLEEGNLEYTDGMLSGGSFAIDMSTIMVGDLEGEYKGKLENHLKSDDFFGVKNYPTAEFVITEVISRGKPGDYRITGDLTIKETTKPVKFNASITEEGGKHVAMADITIDRAEYNVRYGSGSFFDNLGDKTIYDEFDLQVKLVANK